MNTKVNFGFISGLEGGCSTVAYVPDPDHSNSGVTVASGFDLGQRSKFDLAQLLPPELAARLRPYAGLKGQKAVQALELYPLTLDAEDAELIDRCAKAEAINRLQQRYDAVSRMPFASLPEQAQTVIASVAFQYGDLASRCPRFWAAAVNADIDGMAIELRDFGDRYQSRRHREANYLQMQRA